MKEIKLTQGKVALVDDEDFDFLNQWSWCAHTRPEDPNTFYAVRRGEAGKILKMHRVILSLTDISIVVDHIDHNGLNNQKSNLRATTHTENCFNARPHRNSTSKYKGVSFNKSRGKWEAQINGSRRKKFLGYFLSEEAAAAAYNEAAKKLYGDFAYLNPLPA